MYVLGVFVGKARLVEEVEKLVNNPSVRALVEKRMKEFQALNSQYSTRWFEELVFCILTANSSAEMGLKCVEALKQRGYISEGSMNDVQKTLKDFGYRFPRKRAEYIVLARRWRKELKENVMKFEDISEARDWLIKNIKGLGPKEASHFLRNVGYFDIAVVDRHVFRTLCEHDLVLSTTLTKKKYLECEGELKEVAKALRMPIGKLDLYLWYAKTGKVLK